MFNVSSRSIRSWALCPNVHSGQAAISRQYTTTPRGENWIVIKGMFHMVGNFVGVHFTEQTIQHAVFVTQSKIDTNTIGNSIESSTPIQQFLLCKLKLLIKACRFQNFCTKNNFAVYAVGVHSLSMLLKADKAMLILRTGTKTSHLSPQQHCCCLLKKMTQLVNQKAQHMFHIFNES